MRNPMQVQMDCGARPTQTHYFFTLTQYIRRAYSSSRINNRLYFGTRQSIN